MAMQAANATASLAGPAADLRRRPAPSRSTGRFAMKGNIMLKKTVLTTLSLILLSGAAMAGEGLSNMWEMRARMDAQLQTQQQQAPQAQDAAGK